MENRKIIEINGVKLDVDLSTAKRIDEFRVGDIVKVLKKEYSDYRSFAGTIIGFDNFKELPTIIIAYLETGYNAADIKFVYYNAQSQGVEICMANKDDISFDKNTIVEKMNSDIKKKYAEINEIEQKRDYFVNHFTQCFGDKFEVKL